MGMKNLWMWQGVQRNDFLKEKFMDEPNGTSNKREWKIIRVMLKCQFICIDWKWYG